jgi:hypothetical protein
MAIVRPARPRHGFGLYGLIAVLVVIGALLALFGRAVWWSRTAARQSADL